MKFEIYCNTLQNLLMLKYKDKVLVDYFSGIVRYKNIEIGIIKVNYELEIWDSWKSNYSDDENMLKEIKEVISFIENFYLLYEDIKDLKSYVFHKLQILNRHLQSTIIGFDFYNMDLSLCLLSLDIDKDSGRFSLKLHIDTLSNNLRDFKESLYNYFINKIDAHQVINFNYLTKDDDQNKILMVSSKNLTINE